MSLEDISLEDLLAQLRRDFDQSFAAPPSIREGAEIGLVLLGMGEDRLAVRLGEITALVACPALVSVPSRAPDLLGIAGIRGGLVPVFSLAMLTGYGREPEPPRWLFLAGTDSLGFACARLLGHARAPVEGFRPIPASQTRSPHVDRVVTLDQTPIPVVSVASILGFLVQRPLKESQP